MRKILLSGFFLLVLTGLVQAQRIPLEVSFGVGGYFPEDGRYSHYFDHNPANFSGQVVYGWKVLDIKAGFERMQKRTNSSATSRDVTVFPPDEPFLDSVAIRDDSSSINSYMRASSFRFGVAFQPFRKAAFSPYFGFGGSVVSTKGYGDNFLVTDSAIIYADTTKPVRTNSQTTSASIPPFSESVFGTYIEVGVKTQLPYNLFFVVEAIRDFRSNSKQGVLGPANGGGTLLGIRLGYRF